MASSRERCLRWGGWRDALEFRYGSSITSYLSNHASGPDARRDATLIPLSIAMHVDLQRE